MQTSSAPSRPLNISLFLLAGLWILVANRLADSAANGIGGHVPVLLQPLLEPVFLLFLLYLGLSAIARMGNRGGEAHLVDGLPQRVSSREEWLRGISLGWLIALVAVVPMMLVGALHPEFWLGPRNWAPAILSVVAIAIGTLASEIAFRGFLYKRLIAGTGVVVATIVVSLIYALASIIHPNSNWLSMAVAFSASVLLCVAFQRTNALWVSWGIHFGWAATTAVLLGLPTAGDASLCTIITTSAEGANWLTGGPYGPDGAFLTLAIHLLAIVPLYYFTRDYAWRYTHMEILPGGVPVVIAPPAAHTEMEDAAAARPAPLVQILSTTSSRPSTMPAIEEHLRKEQGAPLDGTED
ncbi:CPBP family intramembrane glutamic endopeptidase [Granulicella paludicola]|uniref:CPBP family intramembrane glutamic endopeptidase n=1 Tax=Granulicella paludicola TaxID=474951 RepID=UPI0021DFACB4|nr:CPBP family intramembrane glutamic endopeptidase [Granulicella paludicola]